MNIKTVLKTSVAAAALVAVGAPAVVSQAEAGLNNGNKNGVVMSGQIVRALVYQDNGDDSELFNADGVNTRSRIRWIVSGQMTESVDIGGLVEMNLPASNAGGNALGATTETTADTAFAIRHSRIDFKHKAAGTLSLGQSSVAGDGGHSSSFEGGAALHSVTGQELMYSSGFRNKTAGTVSTITAGGGFDPSREDRIRYDTPSFGGLKLAVSHQDSGQSAGINYSGKFGGIQVAAAGYYRNLAAASTTVDAIMGGSIAAKHDSGLSASVGYSKEDAPSGTVIEGTNVHVGVGYAASMTNLGTTSFKFTWSRTEEGTANNDEDNIYGVSVNQNVASVGADLFAGFMIADYDGGVAGTTYDDFSVIYTGARLNF